MCERGTHHGHTGCGCWEGHFGPPMGHGEHHGGYGCCHTGNGPGTHFQRRFPTREERIRRLEEYLKDLQAEAKAVEERLAEMKANS